MLKVQREGIHIGVLTTIHHAIISQADDEAVSTGFFTGSIKCIE